MKGESLPPKPSAMIEALRDIGYSLEAAVADIVDNSITAEARNIHIRFGWAGPSPWVAILDDGKGMAESELIEAMRPGSRNPRERRGSDDLGRFGLGLKTASFSQCRCLTVVSRQDSKIFARRWDLDEVVRRDQWILLTPPQQQLDSLPALQELGVHGTYVLWQGMDRLDLGEYGPHAHALFNHRVDSVRTHLALVFHRFMAPEPGFARIKMFVNNDEIQAFDPFNARHPATQHLQEERVRVGDSEVVLQPYILPHHTKVSPPEYECYASEHGYLRSQGFYVYRARRLIRHGTWFRLSKQEELTKLARVKIDIPNSVDHLWAIDVRKSRANPPEAVRSRMRQVVDRIRDSARRPYTHRGNVIQAKVATPVWLRRVFNERIAYEVNVHHPLLEDFHSDLDESLRTRFDQALKMIAATFPAPLFFADMGNSPIKVEQAQPDKQLLLELARTIKEAAAGMNEPQFHAYLLGLEPFASWPHTIDWIVTALAEGE